MDKLTQQNKILQHLEKNGSITSMEAFSKYSITRLSGRIFDLRKLGYAVETELVPSKNGGCHAKYFLKEN